VEGKGRRGSGSEKREGRGGFMVQAWGDHFPEKWDEILNDRLLLM